MDDRGCHSLESAVGEVFRTSTEEVLQSPESIDLSAEKRSVQKRSQGFNIVRGVHDLLNFKQFFRRLDGLSGLDHNSADDMVDSLLVVVEQEFVIWRDISLIENDSLATQEAVVLLFCH